MRAPASEFFRRWWGGQEVKLPPRGLLLPAQEMGVKCPWSSGRAPGPTEGRRAPSLERGAPSTKRADGLRSPCFLPVTVPALRRFLSVMNGSWDGTGLRPPARRAQGLLRIASASCRRRAWSDVARSSAPVSASCAPPAPGVPALPPVPGVSALPPAPGVSALPPASSSFCGRTPAPRAGSFQRRAVMPSRDAVPFAFPFCSRARIAGSCTAEPELASGFTAGSLRPRPAPAGMRPPLLRAGQGPAACSPNGPRGRRCRFNLQSPEFNYKSRFLLRALSAHLLSFGGLV